MLLNLTMLFSWIIIMVILIFRNSFKKAVSDIENKQSPGKKTEPQLLSTNDKIVIVKHIEFNYLTQAIIQFCKLYNQEGFIVLPRVVKENYLFVITFPYNIEFDKFCCFVNHLGNAGELSNKPDYRPYVKAWCTIQTTDPLFINEMTNKKVMLFFPESEMKLDRMYLTTYDNQGYKMNISQGNILNIPDPVIRYENIPIEINLLKHKNFVDFI